MLFEVGVRKKFHIVFAALLIVGCAGPGGYDADFSHDAIVRDFVQVTTKSEMEQNVETGIRKWMSPIVVHIDKNAPKEMENRIRDHLQTLRKLSGVSIFYSAETMANFVVYTPKQKDVPALIRHSFRFPRAALK